MSVQYHIWTYPLIEEGPQVLTKNQDIDKAWIQIIERRIDGKPHERFVTFGYGEKENGIGNTSKELEDYLETCYSYPVKLLLRNPINYPREGCADMKYDCKLYRHDLRRIRESADPIKSAGELYAMSRNAGPDPLKSYIVSERENPSVEACYMQEGCLSCQ